ncbi:hypothetical protein D3C87_1796140 [compost metagenome]
MVDTSLITVFGFLDHLNNRERELLSKGKVALIVSGHSHDSTSAIATKYVVCDPDRHLYSRSRIKHITTRESA